MGSQLGDVFEKLLEKMEDLESVKDDVQRRVDSAPIRGELILDIVRKWLLNVESIHNDVNQLNSEANDLDTFFKRWYCSARLSKEANMKIGIVNEFLNEGKSISSGLNAIGDFEPSESNELAMKEIIKALRNDEINIIGVHGIQGIGKTTWVRRVANTAAMSKLVDKVLMVTASNDSFLRITENLDNKKILIILDGLLNRIVLNRLKCKVIFTTRNVDICHEMEAKLIIKIDPLLKQASWNLFRRIVGDAVDSPEFGPVGKEILNICMGHPGSIRAVGWELRKRKSLMEWEELLEQFKLGELAGDSYFLATSQASIKLSFDNLASPETKLCFLFCCIFARGHQISIDQLFRYVIGEKLFRDIDNMVEGRKRFHSVIDRLVDSSLLSIGNEDGYIMVHGIVRKFSVTIASEADYGFIADQKTHPFFWSLDIYFAKCKRLSLPNNFRGLPDQLECPELLTFSLQSNIHLKKIPGGFFEGMKSLLNLDLSETNISFLPPSLSCLQNLRMLCLDYCKSLKDVSRIEVLKNLQILSLKGCTMEKLAEEIGKLVELKILDLSYCVSLKTVPPNVLSSLYLVEELHMKDSFSKWEIKGKGDGSNASLFEVASLRYLTTLHLTVGNVESLPNGISDRWENLRRFSLTVGDNS